MPSDESVATPAASGRKSTGELKAPTGSLKSAAPADERARLLPIRRDFTVRLGELVIGLAAILGAVAIGLGITAYFSAHPYVVAYLLAYAIFRLADLLVRDRAGLIVDSSRFARRVMYELPVLALFFAAPFERTFVYGGEAPRWLGALGLLIELAGIWLALGARIQQVFFSPPVDGQSRRALVRSGLYRYIRHPIYAGELVLLLGWPFQYCAPVTLVLAVAIGLLFVNRLIRREEADMMAEFGDAYAAYRRLTDRMIPNLW
ncbi:MAG TPA: isoprenylcysteine carboxylmethyltransferase family protein [Candidatus Binataceae bacterium]|nr:isoprenylcysteine carboxylmethyltransferase family protein [Candidatus Binataceae bacterium]